MSDVIDNKVVQMTFDNGQFEQGVKESLKSIRSLEDALEIDDVDMSGLTKPLEETGKQFDLLKNIAQGVFIAIGEEIVGAGKKIVNFMLSPLKQIGTTIKDLTVNQISSGFSKYDQKTQAIQTIIAATGKSIEEVTEQVERLNWYTDETSFNLVDMISNIGKFTSNGVDLNTAVTAMEGIGNAAGLAGSGVQGASHAMEGFSKAIAAGKMELRNWQWIKTARMDTMQFKNTLLEAAAAEGTLKKISDGVYQTAKGNQLTYANFEEYLSEDWLTTEVMLRGLDEYGRFADRLNNLYRTIDAESKGITTSELIDAVDQYTSGVKSAEELSEEWGLSIEETTERLNELASAEMNTSKKAFKASQEAKTFAEALDSVKDAASTAWMGIYETIFGNYEDAKKLFTGLANSLYDIFVTPVQNLSVIFNKWRNNDEGINGRIELFQSLSWVLQDLSNVISPFKRAFKEVFFGLNDEDSILESIGLNLAKATQKFREFVQQLALSEDAMNGIKTIITPLASIFRILLTVVKNAGKILGEIIVTIKKVIDILLSLIGVILPTADSFDILNGVIETLNNVGDVAVLILKTLTTVIGSLFGVIIYGIKKLVQFTKGISDSVKQSKIATDIFDLFAYGVKELKDQFANLYTWLTKTISLIKQSYAFNKIKSVFADLAKQFKSVSSVDILSPFAKLKEIMQQVPIWEIVTTAFAAAVGALATALGAVAAVIVYVAENFGKLIGIAKNVFLKVTHTVKETVVRIVTFIKDKVTAIIDWFKNGGVKNLVDSIIDHISMIWEKIKNIDWAGIGKDIKAIGSALGFVANQVYKLALNIALLRAAWNFGSLLKSASNFVTSFSGVGDGLKNVLNSLSGTIASWRKMDPVPQVSTFAENIKQLAIMLGVLFGALFVFSFIPIEKLEGASVIMMELIAVIGAVIVGMMMMAQLPSVDMTSLSAILKSLSALSFSMIAIAASAKIFETLNADTLGTTLIAFGASLITLVGALFLIGKYVPQITTSSVFILAFSFAIRNVVKSLSDVSDLVAKNGTIMLYALGELALVILALLSLTKVASDLKLTSAIGVFLLLTGVILIFNRVQSFIEKTDFKAFSEKMNEYGSALAILAAAIVGTVAFLTIFAPAIMKAGIGIGSIGVGILMTVEAIRLLANISLKDIVKGIVTVSALGILFTKLLEYVKIGAQLDWKMMLSMTAGLGGFCMSAALSLSILSGLSVGQILSGTITLTALSAMLLYLLKMEKDTSGIKISKMIGLIVGFGAMLLEATIAMAIVGLLPDNMYSKGMLFVATIGIIFSGMLVASKNAEGIKKGPLLTMALILGEMAAAMIILANYPTDNVMAAGFSLAIGLASFALVLSMASKISSTIAIKPLLSLSACIAIIATSLGVLANVTNPTDLISSGLALFAGLVSFAAMLWAASKLSSKVHWQPIISLTATVAVIGASLAGLTAVLNKSSGGMKNLIASGSVMAGLIVVLTAAIFALSKIKYTKPMVDNHIRVLKIFVAGMAIIGASLAATAYSNAGGGKLISAAGGMALVIAALAGAMWVLSKTKKVDLTTIGTLAIFAGTIAILGAALYELQDVDVNKIWNIVGAIGAISGIAVVVTVLLGLVSTIPMVNAGIIIAAAAFGIIIGVLALFVKAVASTAEAFGFLINSGKELIKTIVVALKQLSENADSISSTFPGVCSAIAKGLVIIGKAVSEYSSSLIIIGLGLLIISAAFTVFANALTILPDVFNTISDGVDKIVESFISLGKNADIVSSGMGQIFDVLVEKFGAIIENLKGGEWTMIAFSASIWILSAATSSILSVIVLFSEAITSLVTAIDAVTVSLQNMAMKANEIAPGIVQVMSAVGTGLSNIFDAVGDRTGTLLAFASAILVTSLAMNVLGGAANTIAESIKMICESFVEIAGIGDKTLSVFEEVYKIIDEGSSKFSNYGKMIADSFIGGWNANFLLFETAGSESVNDIIKGIESASGLTTTTGGNNEFTKLGSTLANSFISGFNNKIITVNTRKNGQYFGYGFTEGILDTAKDGKEASTLLTEYAQQGIIETAEIHSPGWFERVLGRFFGDGFVEGIKDKYGVSEVSGGTMAQYAIDGLKSKIGIDNLSLNNLIGGEGLTTLTDEWGSFFGDLGDNCGTSFLGEFNEEVSKLKDELDVLKSNLSNIEGQISRARGSIRNDQIFRTNSSYKDAAEKLIENGSTASYAYESVLKTLKAQGKVTQGSYDNIMASVKELKTLEDSAEDTRNKINEINTQIEESSNTTSSISDDINQAFEIPNIESANASIKDTTESVEKLSKAFDATNISDVLSVVGDNFAKTFITSQKYMFETGAFAITKELGNGLTEFEYDTEKQTEVAMSFMSKFVTKLYDASVTAEESMQNVKKVVGSNLQEASKELHKHGYSLTEIATMYETTEDAVLDALGVTRSEYDKALTAYAMKTKGITESSQNQCEELAETANDLSGNISDTSDELVAAVDKAGNAFEIFDKQAIYNLDAVQEKFGSFVSNIENKISGYLNLFEKIEKDPDKILEAEQERAENTVSGTELLADMKENLNNYQDYVNKIQAIFTKGGEAITDSFKDIILGLDPSDTKLDSFLQMSQEQLEEAIAITSSSDAIKSGFANQITSSLITTGSVFRDSFFEPLNAEESYEVFNAFATGGVEALNNAFRIATGRSEVSAEVGKAVDEGIKDGIEVNAITVESSVMTLGNGITDAYEQVCGEEIWVDNGKYIAEGLANGISSNSVLATSQARKLGTSINSAFRMETAIASPSKVFAENGMYIDEGLAVGIERYSKIATAAASNMADDVTEAGSTRLTTVWTDDMDLNPVITPILDLSKVTEGLSQLHAMFNNEKLSVNENGQNDANTSGNTYTFTQNNYSPKSLSRADIYRQTKNQFSQLKGALG